MGNSKTCPSQQWKVYSLATSQKDFAKDLYLKMAEGSSGNIFFSPFGVMAGLAMLCAGAKGKTKDEIKSVLHLSQKSEAVHKVFRDIFAQFKNKDEHFELRTSNLVYIPEKLSVLPDYSAVLSDMYQSSIKGVNFADSKAAVQEINSDVDAATNSRLKDVMPEGDLSQDTRMVLVNAFYFKGLWNKEFKKSNTIKTSFWISSKESVKVPMMRSSGYFSHGSCGDIGASVLSMNYKGGNLSMIIVLPSERDGLPKVEAKLAKTGFISSLEKTMKNKLVDVVFPRFELEETSHLIDHLWILGIRNLFDGKAGDLSGITEDQRLSVSCFVHKAVLKVDEEGGGGEASTCVESSLLCVHQPLSFRVDHPFIFCIRDGTSGFMLFTGRVINPLS
ncbi:serpin B4-like isoform X2 [Penaeus japonicus]|uniref:serpin B4-like isoform X2 n=1 Tax=Penaeus japonicus TaxID=27405 RepID=UPI001C70CA7B|nr:serpin B4-like isoform X2 [Penaeus japonicus]